MRARLPTPSTATFAIASSGIRCKLHRRSGSKRQILRVLMRILSLSPRSQNAQQRSASSTTRPKPESRRGSGTSMIRITSAPRPCSPFRPTSLLALSQFLGLALPTISVDQRERREQAPVYVSRHRKSSIIYVLPHLIIHRVLVSHELHVLYSCPRSIFPFSCLERS